MSKLTFYVDGQKLDISENIDFTRIYRGLETTDTKKNNYSLTVKFPFTYTNDLIFKRTNSLTYKSNFPYETHECDVVANAVVLISKANLILLSTTDSYECTLTWEDNDIIGNIINSTVKLGLALSEFPLVEWNFNDPTATWNYTTTKTSTYGVVPYYSYGKNYFDFIGVPTGFNQPYSMPHPIVNFFYLLNELFTALDITVNMPIDKEDFLKSLIIRPNERINTYKNNIFKCCFFWSTTSSFSQCIFMIPNFKNITYLEDDKNLGNNSFYFKVETLNTDGIDYVQSITSSINVYDPVNDNYVSLSPKQLYRVTCLYDCTATLNITNCFNTTDYCKIYKFDFDLEDFVYLDQFTYADTLPSGKEFTYNLKKDDFLIFIFPYHNTDMYFELDITVDLNEDLKGVETPMNFPSFFHIPSCITLTVGQLITEALNLTGSQLTYDVNSDEFTFSQKTKQNATAFDITKYVTSIKEVSYDTKYLFNTNLGQNNYYKYLSTTPINGDYNKTFANSNLALDVTQVQSLFSTSDLQSGLAKVRENYPDVLFTDYLDYYYNIFVKQPLHIFFDDLANNRVVYKNASQNWNVIFDAFYTDWFEDLETRILSGTVRLVKLNASISDFEFKRINTKGIVYIKTYGKFYGVIEIAKNGDFAEFFLLELY